MSISDKQGTVPFEEASLIAQIHISVRGLVEFILRSGDIDNRRGSSGGPDVMLEGANAHRMIQRRMGTNYHAEYYLSYGMNRKDYRIVLDGRADGIIIPNQWEKYIEDMSSEIYEDAVLDFQNEQSEYDSLDNSDIYSETIPEYAIENNADNHSAKEHYADRNEETEDIDLPMTFDGFEREFPEEWHEHKIVIDEIKSTYKDLDKIKEPDPIHLAQAKCYAYIFSAQNKLPFIGVRMTYVNLDTHEVRYFDSEYSFAEISEWFMELMRKYVRWADHEITWKYIRNDSIDAISFPYEYRSGQRELVAQVYKSIDNRERLFVMAPTGVGKTLANVYPSLKAMGNGMGEKIFYLTAKTITRTVAADCLNLLRQQKLRVKSITLTAKEKICPCEKPECNPDNCPYAKGHMDRVNNAMYDMLMNEDEFSREKIVEYSEKHMVCPFEFSLDMSLFADVIVCDYNYVFDPNVYLKRYFSEGVTGKYLFLIDEAHNLVDRAMSMYSAKLIKEQFLEVKRLVKDKDNKLARRLESCNKHLLTLKRECEDVRVVEDYDTLVMHLLRLSSSIEQFMDDYEHFEFMEEVLDLYFEVRHFLNIFENMKEEDYVFYTEIEENGDFVAHLMCANPAEFIKRCTDKARFTVFFSATMIPIGYYRKMFGARESDPAVYAKSVFDPAKRLLVVGRDVTSKYTRRNEAEYGRMAEYIAEISRGKAGNYIAFFPSFAMLERVYELYMSRYYDENVQEVVVQNSSMNERDREEFIEKFTGDDTLLEKYYTEHKPTLGFCVLGGIFSEGIDLKNDALIGAIIIGTGLPMVCPRRQLLKQAYEDMGLDGFAYAYRYPGMNKVLQAAGRVIRTIDDRGVVALLDERFLNREYMSLFPREWSNYKRCTVGDVMELLEDFW